MNLFSVLENLFDEIKSLVKQQLKDLSGSCFYTIFKAC